MKCSAVFTNSLFTFRSSPSMTQAEEERKKSKKSSDDISREDNYFSCRIFFEEKISRYVNVVNVARCVMKSVYKCFANDLKNQLRFSGNR